MFTPVIYTQYTVVRVSLCQFLGIELCQEMFTHVILECTDMPHDTIHHILEAHMDMCWICHTYMGHVGI